MNKWVSTDKTLTLEKLDGSLFITTGRLVDCIQINGVYVSEVAENEFYIMHLDKMPPISLLNIDEAKEVSAFLGSKLEKLVAVENPKLILVE
ncbi:MAG: hypothetical protein QM500_12710 [Methylococcales bacterium]